MGENWPAILPEIATSTSIQGYFTCRKSSTWDPRLYFPSEGRRAEEFFALKNSRRLRLGLNQRTWVLKSSTLPPDHRSSIHIPCAYKLHFPPCSNSSSDIRHSLFCSFLHPPVAYFFLYMFDMVCVKTANICRMAILCLRDFRLSQQCCRGCRTFGM